MLELIAESLETARLRLGVFEAEEGLAEEGEGEGDGEGEGLGEGEASFFSSVWVLTTGVRWTVVDPTSNSEGIPSLEEEGTENEKRYEII